MTKRALPAIALMLTLLSILPARAAASSNAEIKQQMLQQLSKSRTAADSVPLLWNIYDLSSRSEKTDIAYQLLGTAQRAGDNTARLDIIRLLAVNYSTNDSVLEKLRRYTVDMPPSDDRRETLTFINIYRGLSRNLVHDNPSNRDRRLKELLKKLTELGSTDDLYLKIETLIIFNSFLAEVTSGSLLSDYYDKLQVYIDQLPANQHALRSMFFSLAPVAYTNTGDATRAVEADRRMLHVINDMKKRFDARGRVYRNYYSNYYRVYSRMISNHPALSPSEIEQCWNKIIDMTKRDPDLAAELDANPMPHINYLMATKQYTKVLPMLKAYNNPSESKVQLRHRVRDIIEAARALGDSATVGQYTSIYCDILDRYIDEKSSESIRELQIIYNVNDLKAANSQLAIDREQQALASHRTITIITSITAFLLLVLAIVLWRYYRHSRRLAGNLTELNKSILSERDNLRQTQAELIAARDSARDARRQTDDFVNNIAHEITSPLNAIVEYALLIVDCVDDDKRRYLDRFARNVVHNTSLLQSLVGELLNITTIDNAQLSVNRTPTSTRLTLSAAADKIRSVLQPRVKFHEKYLSHPDVVVNIDPRHLELIVTTLLDNAAKFTPEGSISLDYALDKDKKILTVTVTDTGIGIPEGKEERAFDRFEKFGRAAAGIGLGLPIARHVAELLDGTLVIDTTYTAGGTRVILTIPV